MYPESSRLLEMLMMLFATSGSHANIVQQPNLTIREPHVLAVGEFQKNEGCVAGFKRLGYKVTVTQCSEAAIKVGIQPIWSNASGKVIIDVPVNEGDPFAVIEKNGKKIFMLYKQK